MRVGGFHTFDSHVALSELHDFTVGAHGLELLDAFFEIALGAGTLQREVLQGFCVALVDDGFDRDEAFGGVFYILEVVFACGARLREDDGFIDIGF